jgi:hypothetical protein
MTKPLKVPGATDNLVDVPTVAEYKAAFKRVRDRRDLSAPTKERWLTLVRENYWAHNRAISAEQLANRLDYRSASAMSLQYVRYATELCTTLQRSPSHPLAILVTFASDEQAGETAQWTLLPQVVQALEQLSGWVGKARTPIAV